MKCEEIHVCSPRVGKFPQYSYQRILFYGAVGLLLGSLPLAAQNQAPVVTAFTASPSTVVAPGEVVTLTVNGRDPDCDGTCDGTAGCGEYIHVNYTIWIAGDGILTENDDGVNGSPYTETATWQAPVTEGTYTITVQLGDSGSFFCGGREYSAVTPIDIQVTTTPNLPPVIDSLSADATQLFPAGVSNLTCTAHDDDGTVASYEWTTDHGAVTPGTGGDATFTAAAPGVATVTCTVTDDQGAPTSASIRLSVSDAVAERMIRDGLGAPQRLAVDSMGDVYVVDRAGGGLSVVRLEDGEWVYSIPLPGATSVAVDDNDDLLVGTGEGARLIDRWGGEILALDPGEMLGGVADVAVVPAAAPPVDYRYAALYRTTAVAVLYDAGGARVRMIGGGELQAPQGLAVAPSGQLVVADSGHGMIKVFNPDGTLASTMGAPGNGSGEFVRLGDVAVGADGVIYATDAFQSWVQSFNPDGSLREILGTHGSDVGEFKTPTGVAPVDSFSKLIVASLNSSSVQVFQTAGPPPGSWPVPQATPSHTELSFADQAVGTASAPATMTVTNSGDAPLGIRRSRTMGDFAAGNDCGRVLDPGAFCTFAVTFTPQAGGPRSGTLGIETGAGNLSVALSGTGFLLPTIQLWPSSLAFVRQAVGTTSGVRSVTLTNTGATPVAISAIQPSAQFGLVHNCGGGLAALASCTIDVYFTPALTGGASGSITIASTAAGSPHTIPLDGFGVWLELRPAPGVLGFTELPVDTASDPRTVTVTNVGEDTVDIAALVVAGTHSESFEVQDDLCSGTQLAAGGSCTFQVVFRPALLGALDAEVRVTSNSSTSPDVVSLTGGSHVIFIDGFESGDTSVWSQRQPLIGLQGTR